MKIAPALREVVLLGHSAYPEDEQTTRAAKELRALLAVARATGRALRWYDKQRSAPSWFAVRTSPHVEESRRAYARLARVSGGTKGRRR